MKLTKRNARARAEKLVQEIQGLIERGEFVPEYGYLNFDEDGVSPCGCALGAAAVTAGVDKRALQAVPSILSKSAFLRSFVQKASIATKQELLDFEDGYERNDPDRKDGSVFFEAGKSLHPYHPYFRSG
jgi:hypothetical protein